MALISLNLGSSNQTINDSNANDGDTIRVTSLGSQTLTVDGVAVSITEILGAQVAAEPVFEVVNGGDLTFQGGLGDVSALNSITYRVGDSSQITVEGSLLNVNINRQVVDFTGSQDGQFAYDPGGVSVLGTGDVDFEVTGLEAGDMLAVDGRSNLNFSYNPDTGRASLTSNSLLSQDVTYRFDLDAERAALIEANEDSFISDGVFTFPALMPICFTRGTQLATIRGNRRIEDLEVGDKVLTMDRGFRPIVWIGRTRLHATGRLRPVRIQAGTLRNTNDLVVSPQHKVLLPTDQLPGVFDSGHVLVPAKNLLNRRGVEQEPEGEVEYYHILFDQHEIVFSEGIPSESFHPGKMGISSIDKDTRKELFELFPELSNPDTIKNLAAARSVALKHEADLLLDALARV